MYKIEHLGDYFLEVGGVGKTKLGTKLICSEKVALDLSKDKRFSVTGLSKKVEQKPKKKEEV